MSYIIIIAYELGNFNILWDIYSIGCFVFFYQRLFQNINGIICDDLDNDGNIDAVETLVWEEGACETQISWSGFSGEEPLLSITSSPYINGTGYGLLNFCDDAGHVQ